MGFLEALDPLDILMGLATIFGTYIAYKGYQLSLKEFKLNCAELGLSNKEAVLNAWQTYQSYMNSSLSEKNDMLQEANQLVSTMEDTQQVLSQKLYENYSYNKSMQQQYSQALKNADNISIYNDLKEYANFHNKYKKDANAITAYQTFITNENKYKMKDVRDEIKNSTQQLKNTEKQITEQTKKQKDIKEGIKNEEKVINGSKETSSQRAFIHPYF